MRRRLPVSDVDDVLHDVMLAALEAANRQEKQDFKNQTYTPGYVFTIAKRFAGKVQGNRFINEKMELSYSETIPSNEPSPIEKMISREDSTSLVSAIHVLRSEARALIEAVYFNDIPRDDIMSEIDASPEALRAKLYRARRKIHRVLILEKDRN